MVISEETRKKLSDAAKRETQGVPTKEKKSILLSLRSKLELELSSWGVRGAKNVVGRKLTRTQGQSQFKLTI